MKGFIATILVLALGLTDCENDSQQQLEAQKIAEKQDNRIDKNNSFFTQF